MGTVVGMRIETRCFANDFGGRTFESKKFYATESRDKALGGFSQRESERKRERE